MWCHVSQPNNVLLEVEVDQKANGQECLNKVCELLGILVNEKDYFGLQYLGPKGEQLWLNMRNRIDRQHPGPAPYRFQLKVKFYVHPHMLLQETTRHQFYLQLTSDLKMKTLNVRDEEQLVHILAWMTQAEYGDQINSVQQFEFYRTVMRGIIMPSDELLKNVALYHSNLRGKTRVLSEYNMIQEVASLQNYGMEYHKADIEGGVCVNVGVGPEGVLVFQENMELVTRYPYAIVKKAIHDARKCKLYYYNEDGDEQLKEFRVVSAKAAIALYRCITEMHSFFKCETINNEVFSQRTQDLKDFLASIFSKDVGGQNYVFDVQHTHREVYDSTKRQLLRSQGMGSAMDLPSNTDPVVMETHHSDCPVSDPDEECQKLKDRLEKIEESFICRVCMDNNISTALCPCGHMMCSTCAKQLTDCPLCRTTIDNVQDVYLPASVRTSVS